jgi:PhnB protein
MVIVTPVLNFAGQCEEAMAMYERAFGARTELVLRYSDADERDWDRPLTDAQKRMIYHAEMSIGSQLIMLSDIVDIDLSKGTSQFLALTFDDAPSVKRAYEVMKEGSTVVRPMTRTTYSSCFVSLIDRFGMRWVLMTEGTER